MDENSNSAEVCLTVVMPVYNAGCFLAPAIESVLKQTFSNFEFIIVDDGSVDGSGDVIASYAHSDRRVISIKQQNSGPAVAMNTGISLAKSQWIVVMHSDDIMLPDRLNVIDTYLSKCREKIGIVTASVELLSSDSRIIGRSSPALSEVPFYLNENNHQEIIGGLYHTVISIKALNEVGGYSKECRVNEDVDLYNRIVEKGYGIQVLPETLMQYRIHDQSASSAKARHLLLHWRFLKQCIRRRRIGLNIPLWDEFLSERKKRGLWRRLNERRKDQGKIYYRMVASALSGKNYMKLIVGLPLALMCSPVFFIRRWWDRTQKV